MHQCTDHQPLEHLFGEKHPIPQSTSARISKWALMLMSFDYSIKYAKGQQIPHADALTRLYFKEEALEPDEQLASAAPSINTVQYATPTLPVRAIIDELMRDPEMQRILWRVISGDWNACSESEGRSKPPQNA